LDWKRLRPFTGIRKISAYAYELGLTASIRIHQLQPVSILDPLVDNPLVGQQVVAPPPVEVDGEEEYQVSSVENS